MSTQKGKGKAKATEPPRSLNAGPLPKISQKSLFLALYAKFLSGEKRKNEETEMVMGPQDLGTVLNKQLQVVGRYLSAWFDEMTTDDDEVLGSQGWLEYLYVPEMLPWGSATANSTSQVMAWYLPRRKTTPRPWST